MPIANTAANFDGLGHFLVFGGIIADCSASTNQVIQYDLAMDTWSSPADAPMPIVCSDHEATL